MFSKYSGISIPKNYSGSRFSNPSETSMKTHSPKVNGAVKSGHSPTFATPKPEETNGIAMGEQTFEVFSDDTAEEDIFDNQPNEVDDEEFSPLSEKLDDVSIKEQGHDEHSEKKDSSFLNSFDFSSIKSFFSHFDKDGLIILGIILLLISDESQKNEDMIAILTLLLLN